MMVALGLCIGAGAACSSKLPPGATVEGDGDSTTGDGDGMTGDGDGTPGDGDGDDTPGDGDGTTPVDRNDPSCMSKPLQRFKKLRPDGTDHPDAVAALSAMSVPEKIAILNGGQNCANYDCDFDGTGVPSLGILDFRMRDGPRGVHSHIPTEKSTTFAVAMARGASFDTELEYRVGRTQGREMDALRYDLSLSPQINTLRHPRWARAQESYSEDPYMMGKFGAAYTRGMQEYVPACPKHFAANNTDENRQTMSANLDEQTLRENYTMAFQIVVEEADPACIMAAYNRVNSIYATENPHLLTDILRTDWGWEGFVVSDWWSTVVNNGAAALNAGLDLEMPDQRAFQTLPGALNNNEITNARIDEAALRILNVRARFGQLAEDFTHNNANQAIVNDPEHIAIARETAEKGAVLLKNEGSILPIGGSVSSILMMGPDALVPVMTTNNQDIVHGLGDRGSSNTNPPYAVSYIDGINNRAEQASITVSHSNTVADAANADLIIIPVTMQHQDEGEAFGGGGDRDDMTFSGGHPTHWNPKPTTFINQVAAVNPNVIVLIATGSAVVIEDWIESAPGIVQTFYPGQEAGNAVASLLFGDINFSGKLPFTVGTSENQYPAFGNNTNNVTMEYYHGYKKFEVENLTPRYWFGHGLSYTTFAYSDLELLCDTSTVAGAVNAKVTVTNTGTVAGDEVVMAFIGYPNTAAPRRPVKEIRQWHRTGLLAPGESKDVYFSISARDMRYWSDSGWVIENVEQRLIVAPSADPNHPNKLEASFTLQ